ncbi:MAG: hypothetical protein NVSMB18_23330 [Acetobacteraceae bacterium]
MSDGVITFEDDARPEPVDEANGDLPSQNGRFQPGQSGNPKGRPKKRVEAQSAIQAALNEQVTIKDRKGTRNISAAQAIAKRLVQMAMAGEVAAVKELLRECPNFLKEVKYDDSKTERAAWTRHLVSSMSSDALMEYRHALRTWKPMDPHETEQSVRSCPTSWCRNGFPGQC